MAKTLGPVRRKFAPWDDPAGKPLIEFRNVVKRFGDFTAVDDVSLGIYEKEFFALLGPSGCGKTTLMRMLAGFEHPTEGAIRLAGEDLAGKQPYERPVNMMFQSYALFPHMSVEKNIGYGLKHEDLSAEQKTARVKEMLELVQLVPYATRKPHQISGGQRQRVALARALAIEPRMLLLDEPFGALDARVRKELRQGLREIHDTTGLTTVFVTHDQDEAMELADLVVVMSMGRIEQVGRPQDIRARPATRFVREFIEA